MEERWLGVVGYEGLYEVSDLGRVRRVRASMGTRAGKVKKQSHEKGYAKVNLCRWCRAKTFWVHRLVAKTFLGLPLPGYEVNHKNGLHSDNRVDNLEWVTVAENNLHSYRVLGRKPHHVSCNQGEKAAVAKLKNEDVLLIRRLGRGRTQRELGSMFGVTHATIWNILAGRTWRHLLPHG